MATEKNSIMGWVDRRLPVTENLERHLTKHPVPKKKKHDEVERFSNVVELFTEFSNCVRR